MDPHGKVGQTWDGARYYSRALIYLHADNVHGQRCDAAMSSSPAVSLTIWARPRGDNMALASACTKGTIMKGMWFVILDLPEGKALHTSREFL